MRRVLILISLLLLVVPAVANAAVFAPRVDISTGTAQPYGVAAGDLDGDGLADLLYAVDGPQLLLHLGNGDGTFAAPTSIPTARPAQEIVLLDFDGDGDLDIGASSAAGGTFGGMALRNMGGGTYSAFTFTFGAGSGESDVAAGDVNGNGRPDLVFTNPSTTAICHAFYTNLAFSIGCAGLGGFPSDVALARVDGDALADAAVLYGPSTVELRKGTVSGFIGGFPLVPVNPSASITLADMNGDGATDIVTGSMVTTGLFTARYHPGTGSMSGFGGGITIASGSGGVFGGGEVFVTDVSGDGRNDLVMANPSTTNVVYAQASTFGGGFSVSTLTARPGPLKIAAAALDGNASVDVVVSASTSSMINLFVQASPPSAPQSPAVARGVSELTLSWSAPASDGGAPITAYRVYGGSTPTSLTLLAGVGAGTTSYTQTGLAHGATRYYAVSALNAAGESVRTAVVSATTFYAPSVPQNVTAQPGSAIGEVLVTWGAPADDGGLAPTYEICKGTTSGSYPFCTNVGAATSFSDNGNGILTATYYYVVRASNAAGSSAYSAETCARPFPWHTALGC